MMKLSAEEFAKKYVGQELDVYSLGGNELISGRVFGYTRFLVCLNEIKIYANNKLNIRDFAEYGQHYLDINVLTNIKIHEHVAYVNHSIGVKLKAPNFESQLKYLRDLYKKINTQYD